MTMLEEQKRRPASLADAEPLLEVRGLQVEFRTGQRVVRAVNGASFSVSNGETLAILGESGSGKSVSFDAVLGILESPPGFVTGGTAIFQGEDLFALPPRKRRAICGRRIGMIFQDPLSALNPVYTVGWQLGEMYRVHLGLSAGEARRRSIALLEQVGIPDAGMRVDDYPHQFSGGMRQRLVIAMALAVDPALVVADEPTTALDVTVEAQILALLRKLLTDRGVGLILITHSMGVVAEIADRVSVMYAGRVVETAGVDALFESPAHPYTRGLLASIPNPATPDERLVPIQGQPPDLAHIPAGCPFNPRCPHATEICRSEVPQLQPLQGDRRAAACHHLEALGASL